MITFACNKNPRSLCLLSMKGFSPKDLPLTMCCSYPPIPVSYTHLRRHPYPLSPCYNTTLHRARSLILYSQPLLSLFCEVQNLETEGFQLAGSLLQHSELMRDLSLIHISPGEVGEELVRDVRNDDADGVRLAAAQGAGGVVGLVIEFLRDLQNALGRFLVHAVLCYWTLEDYIIAFYFDNSSIGNILLEKQSICCMQGLVS